MNSFEGWDAARLEEIRAGKISQNVGQDLIFENEEIRVWRIVLQPQERLPFHRHTTNYSWTCLTEGKAISHYSNGNVSEITYEKGDQSFYNHEKKDDLIHDLQNIGNTVLRFTTIEFYPKFLTNKSVKKKSEIL